MEYLLLIIVIVAVAFLFLKKSSKSVYTDSNKTNLSYEYVYKKVDSFLTDAERSFYGVLDSIYSDKYYIFSKVRIADLIIPDVSRKKNYKHWMYSFNKIKSKHIDFVLLSKTDLSIVCAIELNDSSHNSKNRKQRDNFVYDAFSSANVKLIFYSAKHSYNLDDVKKSIESAITS